MSIMGVQYNNKALSKSIYLNLFVYIPPSQSQNKQSLYRMSVIDQSKQSRHPCKSVVCISYQDQKLQLYYLNRHRHKRELRMKYYNDDVGEHMFYYLIHALDCLWAVQISPTTAGSASVDTSPSSP